jgi:hypothetical protein
LVTTNEMTALAKEKKAMKPLTLLLLQQPKIRKRSRTLLLKATQTRGIEILDLIYSFCVLCLSVQDVCQLKTDTFYLKRLKQEILFALRILLMQQQTQRTTVMRPRTRTATTSSTQTRK